MSQGTGMNYRSLAGNMVVAFAAQGISFLASVAMSLLVPKVLGVETYGYWQLFIFTLATLASSCSVSTTVSTSSRAVTREAR